MNKTLLILLTLFSISAYTQVLDENNQSCDWVQKLRETNEIDPRLKIIKENFKEYSGFTKDEPCKVLFILNLKEKQYIFSTDSSIFYIHPELMINTLRKEELNTIVVLNKKVANTLYGKSFNTVILLQIV